MSAVCETKPLRCLQDLEGCRQRLRDGHRPDARRVRVCIGTGCTAKGARPVLESFRVMAARQPEDVVVTTVCTGCHGFCERGPIVIVDPGDVFYQGVTTEDVPEIWQETVLGGKAIERLLYQDDPKAPFARTCHEIPFYRAQTRVALALNGVINPDSIDEYFLADGYAGLAKVLSSMTPEQVIEEVTRSGLRGKGGGGFATGRKWRLTREACGEPKYIVANGDEGDPGAFMDRSLMEGVPHAILEGMSIGAYAVGATKGYIYVRNEYPLAVERLYLAIDEARKVGLLGKDILGTGFEFDVRICRGAGAFVCGEETALITSLEGRVGVPWQKPPYPAIRGLWGKPTCLNNVETWATIPPIILKGAAWHASMGTKTSKGTKAFSLVGKVKNTGIIEVPMGMTLRQIIFEIGGGMRSERPFKAVQTGGPSGGCIPAQFLDTPVDFDELTKLGSMMGSGGMIVMDEDDCLVHVARYFLNFLRQESCGKCTPCREGISQMLHILDRITTGKGNPEDLERLEALGRLLAGASLCALGKTAANPILSTIRYFRKEYEEHIHRRHCPAKVCRALYRLEIQPETCTGCMLCAKHCPVKAITGERKKPHLIDQAKCTKCGICLEKCPFDAIVKI